MNAPQNDPFSTARNREWLGEFREEPGPVRDGFRIAPESLAAYRDKLPPASVALWETDGLGSLYNGQIWMCDPAGYGECYGLAPILPLGGAWRLQNLRRVRALEHFLILAKAQEFMLRDNLSRPIRDVRVIGG